MEHRIAWQGDVVDNGDAAHYSGVFGSTRVHRHYAVQLIECPTRFAIVVDEQPHDGVAVILLDTNVPHAIRSSGIGNFSYFAPHSERGRQLRAFLDGRGAVVLDGPPSAIPVVGDAGDRHQLAVAIVTWVGAQIASNPLTPLRTADVSSQFHLSESAILRVLRDELAVTFSSVVKWERLCVALRLIVEGESVTEAAAGGGFFDGPHFTRVCNEMLGLPPKLLDVGLVRPG
ncbi:helix-turn-helix transcriptional regulator [Gordonia crocea]|uniref:helix-turn-helix transcriptional regulator n=1 Tax=Gordonia crocea TaxID=589162 RepID=UPI00137B903F|nr:helix-turn-helix transcriptional regulator [Gordonia crocea]